MQAGGKVIGDLIFPGAGSVGSLAADFLHRGFKNITGYGDYKVRANTLMTDDVPQFSSTARQTSIRHREYIQDILSGPTIVGTAPNSSTAFNIQVFSINPGLISTFPWFAAVAQNYEEYKIHGMMFEFKSMSANALTSTNTALGTVIMASQYNVLSPPFANKQQMENYEFAASCNPAVSMMHPIECEPHETPIPELFTRTGTPSTGDLRLYDHANFSIATQGMQAANIVIGELWVTYDIMLYKPKLLDTVGGLVDHYILGPGITSGTPFGSAIGKPPTTGSNFGTSLGPALNVLNIPISFTGTLIINYLIYGGSTGVLSPATFVPTSVPGFGIAKPANLYYSDTVSGYGVSGSGVTQISVDAFYVYGGAVLTVSGGIGPPLPPTGDLFVMGFMDNLLLS
jgi:hypothetical protein